MLVVAATTFAVLVVLAGRYGYHRDELYFLQAGRRLAWGYVDQPVLTPAIARLALVLFGRSLVGLRVFPALAAAATVVLGGLLTRELGGGRSAQLVTVAGIATGPALLASAHLHGPTAYDLVVWTALTLLVARIGRTRDTRLWIAAGAVAGVGVMNKHTVGFLCLALAAGLVASGEGALLRSRWFVVGALLVAAALTPEMLWQSRHEWATIAMTRRLNEKHGGIGNVPIFLVAQMGMVSFALLFVWIRGLVALWRSPVRAWRSFAWAYGLLFVFFGVTGGAHPYYVAGMYPVLLAAGAVALERRIIEHRARLRSYGLGMAVSALAAAPVFLPVLPASATDVMRVLNPVSIETIGWDEFDATVARVWRSLPADERRHAVLFTASYGEAGAINELGRHRGLPLAVSGQNSFWWWGPGDPSATTVVVVTPNAEHGGTDFARELPRYFADIRPAARLRNRAGVHNEEMGGEVYVCRRLRRPWGETWRYLRHYD